MKIYLLTHEQETKKSTNTGSIAIDHSSGIVERILWQRVNPNKELLCLVKNNNALLLYPSEQESNAEIEDYENFIIIDGTWQEARKIYNKTPYLKCAPQHFLKTANGSDYRLRKNQVPSGLCTLECVINVLKAKDENKLAEKLESEFLIFNT